MVSSLRVRRLDVLSADSGEHLLHFLGVIGCDRGSGRAHLDDVSYSFRGRLQWQLARVVCRDHVGFVGLELRPVHDFEMRTWASCRAPLNAHRPRGQLHDRINRVPFKAPHPEDAVDQFTNGNAAANCRCRIGILVDADGIDHVDDVLRLPRAFGLVVEALDPFGPRRFRVALLQVRNLLSGFEKDGLDRPFLFPPFRQYASAVCDNERLGEFGLVTQPKFAVVTEGDRLAYDGTFGDLVIAALDFIRPVRKLVERTGLLHCYVATHVFHLRLFACFIWFEPGCAPGGAANIKVLMRRKTLSRSPGTPSSKGGMPCCSRRRVTAMLSSCKIVKRTS